MTRDENQSDEKSLPSGPSNEVLRELYHSVNDAILIQDGETGEILDVNERMCEMYGYSRDEALRLSVADLSSGDPPYTQETLVEYWEKTVEGEPQVFDWHAKDSEGDLFWVEVSMRRATIDDRTLILVIVRDITERKDYEKQIEKTNKELEALNRVVRHDIRNDMNIVLGWTELLEGHVDEEGQDYLRKVLASGQHIVELTDIARDYVETLTSEDDLTVAPTPLRSILNVELDLRRESFPNAEFVLLGEVPDVEVLANEMLGSVFRNLLNNAAQHNDKPVPAVTVSCEVDDEDVVVQIADNGPGIPNHQKDSIFYKGDKGIKSEGSGIGLYLVQTLVRQYNGSVTVEDNEPEGAVFTVRLQKAD